VKAISVLFVAALGASAAVHAQTDARFAALEKRVAAEIGSGQLPSLAVAVISDGRIVYEKAFGNADLAAGRPATVHTAYALASASKPITATAVLQLAERGRIDLDAPARDYLGRLHLQPLAQADAMPRVRQLLDHTAGLPTYAQIYYGDAIAKAPDFARSVARFGLLVQAPGRVAEYSNLGYGLLGVIIERRSGLSFGDYLQRNVFTPLGMIDAFVDAPRVRDSDLAVAYDAQNQAIPRLYNDTPGAGNVHASVHDIARFARFHLDPTTADKPVLAEAGVQRMQRNADTAAFHHYYGNSYYGLGWYVRENDGGERVVWHEGGMPGASSIVKLLPARRIGVVVLANKTEVNTITQAVADEALRALLPGYAPGALDPVANYAPYAAQADFLGEWQGEIQLDGRRLRCTLRFGADGKVAISYIAPDESTVAATLGGIVNGDSFVGAVPLALPVAEQRGAASPLLLVKLLRSGDVLQGALVAYAAPARLDYLLPFYVRLTRVSPPG
jgi:CubicO group peptidase (beta-lactamase class C family)